MNAIDLFTGQPDSGRERDDRLERQIDAAFTQMEGAAEPVSQALLTELSLLVRRRSPFMQVFVEVRWRARVRAA